MRIMVLMALLWLLVVPATAQMEQKEYDPVLAKSLGADDYGMKWYVMAILKTGSNDLKDSVKRANLFAGHFKNIGRLAEMGKLVVAGPFGKNDKSYRGIFILNVSTLEEAGELLQSDPTIQEKVLEAELFKWYGSAALPEYLPLQKKIQKTRIQ